RHRAVIDTRGRRLARSASPSRLSFQLWTCRRRLGRGPRPGHARRARLPLAPCAGCRRRALTDEGVLSGERLERGGNLPPPRNPELLTEHVAMCFGRARGDAEVRADL